MTGAVDPTAIKKKRFLEKFELTKGNISLAAKAAGVSRSAYYKWTQKDGEYYDVDFAEQAIDIIEATGDFVESKLLKNIDNGDTSAIIFFCKTKLKDRGYEQDNTVNLQIPKVILRDLTGTKSTQSENV